MTTLVNIAAVVAFFAVGHFMLTYHLLARWWRSTAGRSVMAWSGCGLGLLFLRMLTIVFGDGYPGQDVLRLVAFVVLPTVAYRMLVLLLRVQLGGPKPEPDPGQ